MNKKYNVNPADYYPHLAQNPYPEFYGETTDNSPFRQGDVVFDAKNEAIAIVLGTINIKGGELRLDTDGMQPIANLRHATLQDFEDNPSESELFEKLFYDCCQQDGLVPISFEVKAVITKRIMVYVSPTDDMSEDDLVEEGRQLAHEKFDPSVDGYEEQYTQEAIESDKLFP